MEKQPNFVTLLYSKYASNYKDIMSLVKQQNFITLISVDKREMRENLIKSKFNIKEVPCILVGYDDGMVDKFEGDNAFEWLQQIVATTDTTQSIKKTPVDSLILPEPDPDPELNPDPEPKLNSEEFHPQTLRENYPQSNGMEYVPQSLRPGQPISPEYIQPPQIQPPQESIIGRRPNSNIMAEAEAMKNARETF